MTYPSGWEQLRQGGWCWAQGTRGGGGGRKLTIQRLPTASRGSTRLQEFKKADAHRNPWFVVKR